MSDANLDFYNKKETADWLAELPIFAGETAMLDRVRKTPGCRVVDIGCGAGRLYEPILEAGANYSGSDIASGQTSLFKMRHPEADVVVADACNLPWEDAYADVAVLSFHVIEAILPRERRLAALREVRRVLRDEGLLFVSHHVRRRYRPVEQITYFLRNIGRAEFGDLCITGNAATGGITLDGYRTHIPSAWELSKLAKKTGFKRQDRWSFSHSTSHRLSRDLLEQWSAQGS
ncbi:class I SAM-dependent methyltransferase [Paenarthrobacter sp. CM16]|uniref:class I SAM-dependent methyltransferase n=1 Tax=Paenarthrobacter sp. CM16 TaxID=2738447 RepID=UPI0015568732|nr:class I SAM-dependent methyltransferase [Paenarthrobacter sp. CM16]NQD90090.1 class I SAM-dependent methyltransferase [Paenarthrobacter sp. CM16]